MLLPKLLVFIIVALGIGWYFHNLIIHMPGRSYRGPMPDADEALAAGAARLRQDVEIIANRIGERHVTGRPLQLRQTEEWLLHEFREMGYEVTRQPYKAGPEMEVANIEAVRKGSVRPDEILIIGAHYDTIPGSPGANDNGSGIAALLEVARQFQEVEPQITVRFVAFANEEPPFFRTDLQGSRVYALGCKRLGENVIGMIALETLGYFSDEPGSQLYPAPLSWFYPDKGNFLAFVGNLASRDFVHGCINSFRENETPLPSEGVAAPEFLPGIGLSDHSSFWDHGYPALMLTDTAMFRYPYYHTRDDTPEKIDYQRLALAVRGITVIVNKLAVPGV